MCFAERMIGQAWQQVMEAVVAQADRSPQRGQCPGWRHVDAVEILRGDAHRLAVILPEVRDESADLIEEHHTGGDADEDEEVAQRHDARRG